MKYVLLNDTSQTNNPGCKGTVACLRELLHGLGLKEVKAVPVGFGTGEFVECARDRRSLLVRWIDRFRNDALTTRHAVSVNRWESGKDRLGRDHPDLFGSAQYVVVNGEGTLHHNQPSALSVLAMIELAHERDLPVSLVNCSIQDMNPDLLVRVLPQCRTVLVREKRTSEYLRGLGIAHQFSPDCLFLHGPSGTPDSFESKSCIYTPGVLCLCGKMGQAEIGRHLSWIGQSGYRATYLSIEVEDRKFHDLALSLGCRVIDSANVSWDQVSSLLARHEIVMSGRYHVIVFSWLAGRPAIPMKSNSWKIEGLLGFCNETLEPVDDSNRMNEWWSRRGVAPSSSDLSILRQQCKQAYRTVFSA